jgi:hypothetical protein
MLLLSLAFGDRLTILAETWHVSGFSATQMPSAWLGAGPGVRESEEEDELALEARGASWDHVLCSRVTLQGLRGTAFFWQG